MTTRAAGILILNEHGQALFLKRGPGGDCPGCWCTPGGRIEDGETAIEAAVRETEEEAGIKIDPAKLKLWTRAVKPRETTGAQPTLPSGPQPSGWVAPPVVTAIETTGRPPDAGDRALVLDGEEVDFTTFITKMEGFIPVLGPEGAPEHIAFSWAPCAAPPEPLHPGCRIALAMFGLDELGIARAMAAGELTSPQHYKNVALFDIRITGTGVAFRNEKKVDGKVVRKAEWVFRRPENYLTDEFVQRCMGLPVIMQHPEKALLNSDEFGARVVGTIMLPYLKGDEVWGVAKVYDADTIEILETEQMSTSPGVLLSGHDDHKITMEDGSLLLIEGKLDLLDHISICALGVWDKSGPATGVNSIVVNDSNDLLNGEISRSVVAIAMGVSVLSRRMNLIADSFASDERQNHS